MARIVFCFGTVLAAVCGFAEVFTWTGAVDGAWTNAANWAVNGEPAARCPGVRTDEIFDAEGAQREGWMTAVHLTDLAEFTTVAPEAATTIDFQGLYCVSSVVFRASCAKFTLGVDEDDVLALQAFAPSGNWASGGRFTVESGATVPTFVGAFSLGATCRPLQASNVGRISVYNYAAEELVFKNMGYTRLVDSTMECAHVYMLFDGTGNFRFDGRIKDITIYGSYKMLQSMWFYFQTSGKITFSSPQFGRGKTGSVYDNKSNCGLLGIEMCGTPYVEIQEGCRVSFSDWNYPTLAFSQSGEIGGKGTLQLCVQNNKGVDGNYGHTWVARDRVGTISCNLDLYDSSANGPLENLNLKFAGHASYSGTFYMAGPTNALSGPIWFHAAPMTYRANRVRNFGTGTTAFFKVNGAFEYAGEDNETFAKDCFIAVNNIAATVRNVGSGMLTVASSFAVTNAAYTGASVVLDAETAPIRFTGGVAAFEGCRIPLVKTGSSTLDLAEGVELSGASSLRLCDGALTVSGLVEDGAATLAIPLTYDTGAVSLVVPDGVTLTLTSLAPTSGKTAGTLNLVCDSGRVKVAGATAETGVPAGVTVNGSVPTFDAAGLLVIAPPEADVSLAAKGDVVPDDATKTVVILSEGTSGDDTLAAATTSVKTLYHSHGADATIAIGEGRQLAAGHVEMLGLAGNLSLGTADDLGTIAGLDGKLHLVNRNPFRAMTVNARVAAETEVSSASSTGPVVLAGGTAGETSLRLPDGSLTLTGARTITLNGGVIGTNTTDELTATLVLDGAQDVVLGEEPFRVGHNSTRVSNEKSVARMVVTNSYVHNADISGKSFAYGSTNDALFVGIGGDAVLTVQAGAVISNRFQIGGYYHWQTKHPCGHGAVIQEGGEVAMLSGGSLGEGSTIGAQEGNGYYELRDGRFVCLGNLSVGHYGTCGSFAQYGGLSVFTNALGSSSAPTVGPNAGANGGAAIMRFIGGRSEMRGYLWLCCGASNQGRSVLTIEEEAEMDAYGNNIKLCGTHSTHNNFAYYKQADFVLNGRLRAAGFYCGYNASCPDYPQFYSVGFDGGTFTTGATGKDIANSPAASNTQPMTNFVVYAKGVTIDTDGKTGNRSSVSFRGAWGKGVATLPFAKGPAYSGFVAAPYVIIYGDGVGATAIADFDSDSGTVTGIRVLTPGSGYTWAKAYFYRDSGYQYADGGWAPVDCGLKDNVNTGDFTKTGVGDFTLEAPNTWGGKTILKGGVLRLGVAGALPTGSKVIYAGGTLESTAAASPAVLTAEVAADLVAARKPVTLITYTDAAPAVLPDVTIEGIPESEAARWATDFYGRELRVKYIRGMVLNFR